VIRTAAAEVKESGRQTMGVRLMNLAAGDSLVAIARNAESTEAGVNGDEAGDELADDPVESTGGRDGGEPEATD
jgi:DNA gyrase subunit A